jgi:hypothetical protein
MAIRFPFALQYTIWLATKMRCETCNLVAGSKPEHILARGRLKVSLQIRLGAFHVRAPV